MCLTGSPVSLQNLLSVLYVGFYTLPSVWHTLKENIITLEDFASFCHGEYQSSGIFPAMDFLCGHSLKFYPATTTPHSQGDYAGLILRPCLGHTKNSEERKEQLTAWCLQGKNNGKKAISSDHPWVGPRHTDQGERDSDTSVRSYLFQIWCGS